jgi:hypothetical protein
MDFTKGFRKMTTAAKGLLGATQKAPVGAASSVLKQRRLDQAALKAGTKYVDLAPAPKTFAGSVPKNPLQTV